MTIFFPSSSVIAAFLLCAGASVSAQADKASNLRGERPGEESGGSLVIEGKNNNRELTGECGEWRWVYGWAQDIGAGAYGVAVAGGGNSIWKLDDTGENFYMLSGRAFNVAVGDDSIVANNPYNHLYEYDGRAWHYLSMNAIDVGVSGDIVCVARPDQSILCKDRGSYVGGFNQVHGGAVRIDVCPNGNPVVVNNAHLSLSWSGSHWEELPGKHIDIACGGDGVIWTIGEDEGIYRWMGSSWERVWGAAHRISVNHHGDVWVVNSAGSIWEYQPNHSSPETGQVCETNPFPQPETEAPGYGP